jgi:hypothetical protein
MSLLSAIQNACDRIGIARPSSVVGSTDQQTLRLLGYAQQEGKELARKYDWQVLVKETTFSSTATAVQTSAGSTVIPADFDRFKDGTFYNRTEKREVYGPLNADEWQYTQSVVSRVFVEAYRVRGDQLLMTPGDTSGDTIAFEYVSKKWVTQQNGTATAAWTADADAAALNEELITLGVVWRFKAAQGLDYAEEFRTYEAQCANEYMRDGGRRVLNMAGGIKPRRGVVIPEGNWSL